MKSTNLQDGIFHSKSDYHDVDQEAAFRSKETNAAVEASAEAEVMPYRSIADKHLKNTAQEPLVSLGLLTTGTV